MRQTSEQFNPAHVPGIDQPKVPGDQEEAKKEREKEARKQEIKEKYFYEEVDGELKRREEVELPTNENAYLIAEVAEEDTSEMVGEWVDGSDDYLDEESRSDDDNEKIEMLKFHAGTPVKEVVSNAIFHGNLEIHDKIEQTAGNGELPEEVKTALKDRVLSQRKVFLKRVIDPNGVLRVVTRDQGAGFDVSKVPDPNDPKNILKPSGRGILYIKGFCDKVDFRKLEVGGMEVDMSLDLKPKEKEEEAE